MAFLAFGWVGVDLFFALSGFLVGRLILEKGGAANFFVVFYARRLLRTVPSYVLVVSGSIAVFSTVAGPWLQADPPFALWTYLTFVQNFAMAEANAVGAHWMAPTWTLAVEEQFYLVAPAAILLTPAAWRIRALLGVVATAVVLRSCFVLSEATYVGALVMLPTRADSIACGVIAALAFVAAGADWARWEPALRTAPIVILAGIASVTLLTGREGAFFSVAAHFLVGLAGSMFILGLARDVPEARRFRSTVLYFFGRTSYALYLVHLPVLWLIHGWLFAEVPALHRPDQWAANVFALPIAIGMAWLLTECVDGPSMRLGRRLKWLKSGPASDPRCSTTSMIPTGQRERSSP